MHDVESQTPDPEFSRCWQAAGQHIQEHAGDNQLNWLKSRLTPPFLEHLSFAMGNQLFFIRIEDESGRVVGPGNRSGLHAIASGCRGNACLLPMRCGPGGWVPVNRGWGLIDSKSGTPVVPPDLVSDEPVEMTDWELHDFAVQTVRTCLEKEGREVMSSQGNPSVDPSLWFVGEDGLEWIVVRAVRYPERDATVPGNWNEIVEASSHLSRKGHFASVAIASSDGAFDAATPTTPLWRGRGMYVSYGGLTPGP
mgnify:CR=1 FL=1